MPKPRGYGIASMKEAHRSRQARRTLLSSRREAYSTRTGLTQRRITRAAATRRASGWNRSHSLSSQALACSEVKSVHSQPQLRAFGLISLLFPESPLVHVVRHPLDVIVSVFSNILTHGFFCAYALESAARHFALLSE